MFICGVRVMIAQTQSYLLIIDKNWGGGGGGGGLIRIYMGMYIV